MYSNLHRPDVQNTKWNGENRVVSRNARFFLILDYGKLNQSRMLDT